MTRNRLGPECVGLKHTFHIHWDKQFLQKEKRAKHVLSVSFAEKQQWRLKRFDCARWKNDNNDETVSLLLRARVIVLRVRLNVRVFWCVRVTCGV